MLIAEHEEGRRRMAETAKALIGARKGEASSVKEVGSNLSAYANLLRPHIAKEEGELFPVADRILTPADQKELIEAFGKVESEDMGEGVHGNYIRVARELAEAYGISQPA